MSAPTQSRQSWRARIWDLLNDNNDRAPAYLRESRNKAALGVVLSIALAILTGYVTWLGPENGLPPISRLKAFSGVLVRSTEQKRDILLQLQGQKEKFDYFSKARGFDQVWSGLRVGAPTTIWIDSADKSIRPTVFQIAVNGRIIRSFAEVRAAWIADNNLTPWLFVAFLNCGLYLAYYAHRQHVRLREALKLPSASAAS